MGALNSFFMPQQRQMNPNMLFGGLGLLGLSQLGRDEPGHVTEARQQLRNLSQPQNYGSIFGQTVGGLQGQFEPFLRQQEEDQIRRLQQAYIAANPTLGQQGGEIASLGRLQREQFIPRRQAFLGELGLQGIGRQQEAAGSILSMAQPNALNAALGTLGGLLTYGGLGGGGQGGFGTGVGGGLTDIFGNVLGGGTGGGGDGFLGGLGRFFGGGQTIGNIGPMASILQGLGTNVPGGTFPRGIEQALSPEVANSLINSVVGSFPQGTFAGGFGGLEPIGNGMYAITQPSGQSVGTLNSATGEITRAGGQQAGGGFFSAINPASAGFAPGWGTGLGTGAKSLGTLGGAFQGLGTAGAGFFAGQQIGQRLPDTQAGASAAGAAGGAATGALIGTFIFPGIGTALGAIIGGLAGGGGGFLGSRGASHAMKAEELSKDQRSQGTTTSSIGSFWTEALGSAGFEDMSGWGNLVSQSNRDVNDPAKDYSFGGVSVNADQPDNLVTIGSQLLLKQIQQASPNITSLDQVQGFRDRYISFILGNTSISSGGVTDIRQKGSLVTRAGLPL